VLLVLLRFEVSLNEFFVLDVQEVEFLFDHVLPPEIQLLQVRRPEQPILVELVPLPPALRLGPLAAMVRFLLLLLLF